MTTHSDPFIPTPVVGNLPATSLLHPSALEDGVLRTKVVCTIGPSSSSKQMITDLISRGMNVARLNLSHCSHEFARKVIQDIREISASKDIQVGVWFDINGPKVRTGKLSRSPIELKKGQEFLFVNDPNVIGDETRVATTYPREILNVGDKLFVDDGNLAFSVVERLPDAVRTVVENTGLLGENKGINFPNNVAEDLPVVSDKDKADIVFGLELGVDFISVSCIRDSDDVEELRFLLGNSRVKLLAKIENKHGMENYDTILSMADGIIVDRGYLGTEVDFDVIAIAQKSMVAKANQQGKPILVANQILESMKTSPRPTRSEAADVANAVMDGVDGLILSSESAVGEYVLECVDTLRKICHQAEKATNYNEFQQRAMRNVTKPIHVNESIASSAVLCARQVGATIIVVVTEAGGTGRLVAKYRPSIPVVAATSFPETARQLSLHFGLVPHLYTGKDPEQVIQDTLRYACSLGLCKPGDIAVVTSGQVIGFLEGTTTKMQVVQVPSE